MALIEANRPEVEGDPFAESGSNPLRGVVGGVALVGAAGLGVAAYRAGIDLDSELVLRSPVVEEITDGIIATNEGLRTVSPPISIAALTLQAGYYIRSRVDRTRRARFKLATTELSGTESLLDNTSDEVGRLNKITEPLRKVRSAAGSVLKGAALIGFAGSLVTLSTSIEEEVQSGPIRTVEAAGDLFDEDDDGPVYVFQQEEAHFMNDSEISAETASVIIDEANNRGIEAHPFDRGLPKIFLPGGSSTDGITLAVPGELLGLPTNQENSQLVPAIVDEALGLEYGEVFDTDQGADVQFLVAGETTDASSMNRSATLMDIDDYTEIVEGDDEESADYFGIAFSGANEDLIQDIVEDTDVADKVAVLTEDEFIENNQKFWQRNGTAILLQTIAYLGAFAGTAIGSAKRNQLMQNIQEIGTILALGTRTSVLRAIEAVRVANKTSKAMAVASLGAIPGLAAGVNATVRGLEVGTSLRSIATAHTVMLAAGLLPSVRALSRFTNKIPIARMVGK